MENLIINKKKYYKVKNMVIYLYFCPLHASYIMWTWYMMFNSFSEVSKVYGKECAMYTRGYNVSNFVEYYCAFLPTDNCLEGN